ncbi:MAG: DUF167 domain-containing protein [Treponema sp.]|nr:DUF167 domain-containing protein [Treponema sp.]
MENYFIIKDGRVHINIKVIPGASKTEFSGIKENYICVRVAAVPRDGKANECLCAYLAARLKCAKRDVNVIKGEKSRIKTVAVPASCAEKMEKFTGKGFTKTENV